MPLSGYSCCLLTAVVKMNSHFVWTLALLAVLCCLTNADSLGQQAFLSDVASISQVEFRVGLVWVQQCVGSVLTSIHILAPAICFTGTLYLRENRRVRAGAARRGEDGVIVGVEAEHVHPNYGLLGADSDISVIRLASALPLGNYIQQVRILGQGITLPIGLTVELFGWGTTAQGGTTSNPNLYSLSLYTQNGDRCMEKYYVLEEPQIVTENMFCVGRSSGGRDFDARDIGAPLFFDNVLVGILAFGASTGDAIPIVSTSVGSFSDWIVATAV